MMIFVNAWGKVGVRFNSTLALKNGTIWKDEIDIYIEPSKDHLELQNYNVSNLNFTWDVEELRPTYMLFNLTINDTQFISQGT